MAAWYAAEISFAFVIVAPRSFARASPVVGRPYHSRPYALKTAAVIAFMSSGQLQVPLA